MRGWPHVEEGASGPLSAHCSIACDGGSIEVALKNDGSIYVTIPEGARVWTPGAQGSVDGAGGAFGADDKLFRVDRAKLGQCLPLANGAEEKALLAGGK